MSERINNFKLPVRMRLDSANRTYYTVCSGFWSTLRALLENEYLAQAAFNFVQKGLPEHFVVEAPTVPQAADAAVRLLLEDGSEYGLTGTLQFADVSVDESTGMVTLRAIFPNPKQELLPGMYVRAILNEGVDDQAILLPQRALLRDAKGNPTTYVVNAENKVEIRPLKVGRTQGNSWVVLDGLKAGDKVIVEGLQKIRPGSPVRIAEPTPVKQGAPASEKR